MTGPYDWNPMPHVVDVRCPNCRVAARFEFAEIVRIKRKEEIAFFRESSQFEYEFCSSGWAGQNWHAAIYFEALHGPPSTTIRELPKGYDPADWEHSKFFVRNHGTLGAIVCDSCGYRRRHHLAWPADAFYQVDYRGEVLWAFNRESAVELRDYIASLLRDRKDSRWEFFLRHVPKKFLEAKARATLVKRLDRLLAPD